MYKTIWTRHWPEFVKIYPFRFQDIYGQLNKEKIDEGNKLIHCGKFQNGFQRHTCEKCGTIFIVPFTSKSRLCLSCYRKKLYGWSIHLSQIMITSFNHAHVTFTLPGTFSKILFEKKFKAEALIKFAAET